MNSQQIAELTTNAITELASELEAGHSEALTRYLAAISRFHKYSRHNVMLIRFAETGCIARRGLPHVAKIWTARPKRRKGHQHICATTAAKKGLGERNARKPGRHCAWLSSMYCL